MTERDELPMSSTQVEVFLAALRRSLGVVQEALNSAAQQEERTRSLEAELDSARQRIAFLERETTSLRDHLSRGTDTSLRHEIEELIEEQSSFANMFVTSDRLARAHSPDEVVAIAVEVLHNLVGAHRFALWLRWDGKPALFAPADRRWRAEPGVFSELIERALSTGAVAKRVGVGADAVPAALPLLHDGETVGVLLVAGMVPQVGDRLGRLQDDLLQFLVDRLPLALRLAALRVAQAGPGGAWNAVREHLNPLEDAP